MSYTADDVKRLREVTAAGMLDCKKALDETGGDFDKAIEIIRVKGLKGVTKREGRATSNGLIAAKAAKMKCIIVPHSSQFEMDKWNIADLKLKSLRDLTHSSLEKILK